MGQCQSTCSPSTSPPSVGWWRFDEGMGVVTADASGSGHMGTLVNEYINRGGAVHAVKKGELYVDVGTLHGYHEALRVLSQTELAIPSATANGRAA